MMASAGREARGRSAPAARDVRIRALREADLGEADRIMREAFGTFLGLPDPASFAGDADYVRTRWRAAPDAAFVAERDGEILGSNFATRWGSFGFFGPLSVRPDLWNRGIAQRLLEPVLDLFSRWGLRQAGLFTFPHSPKHLALYGKHGFHARYLTPVMSRGVAGATPGDAGRRFSRLAGGEKQEALAGCRRVTEALSEGLDAGPELLAVDAQGTGDTVLLEEGSRITGFAACHLGAGSEAGSGVCYVKFGAVAPGGDAAARFERLLAACEALAVEAGLGRVSAGVNLAREEAYLRMLARGYRIDFTGIAMHRPNEPGHSRRGVFALDDWR